MLEAIERLDCYTTGKNNGVSNPDKSAFTNFFKQILIESKSKNFSTESCINCLAYMSCYPDLPTDLRKMISAREKEAYTSLSQARDYEIGESPKVR